MLTLDTRVGDGEVVVALRGELDLLEADRVREAITQAVDTTTGLVVVDLAGLTFCDSVGISTLIRGRRCADAKQVPFRVINPTGEVATVFDVCGVLDYLGSQKPPAD